MNCRQAACQLVDLCIFVWALCPWVLNGQTICVRFKNLTGKDNLT